MPDSVPKPPDSDESTQAVEQRRQSRFVCIDGTRFKLSVCPEFRCRRGLLMDVSTGGIGVLLEEELAVGTRVVFEVLTSIGGPGLSRTAKVRHCRTQPAPVSAPWQPPAPPVSAFFRTLLGLTPVPPALGWFAGCEFNFTMAQDDVDRLLAMLEPEME